MSNCSTVFQETRSSPKMDIFYGLTILIDLAEAFYREGGYLSDISIKHGWSLGAIEPILLRLEQAGLVHRHPKDQDRLMLKSVPEGQWIFEILSTLKKIFRGT